VAYERELLHPVDAQEDRCVGRVEDLVAVLRQPAQDAVEVALHERAEVELGLLDQQHELAQVGREQALHAHDEGEPTVGCRPVMVGERRPQQLCDLGGSRTRGRRDHRARAKVGRQEEHRRRARAIEVERVGRCRIEEDRAALELGFEVDAPRRAA